MMINAWVKYSIAVATVVLGRDYIAPHKMWQIEKNREMINDVGYDTLNALKRLETDQDSEDRREEEEEERKEDWME